MDPDMQQLTTRVDRIEDEIHKKIGKIFEKMEVLAIAAAKQTCPQPGLCIYLQTEMRQHEKKMESYELRILKIETWQSWIMGGIGILLVILTLFGPGIRHLLNLPN